MPSTSAKSPATADLCDKPALLLTMFVTLQHSYCDWKSQALWQQETVQEPNRNCMDRGHENVDSHVLGSNTVSSWFHDNGQNKDKLPPEFNQPSPELLHTSDCQHGLCPERHSALMIGSIANTLSSVKQ